MGADSVLFIVAFVLVIAALAKSDDIALWLTAGDAAPEGREREQPAPVALSAAQQLLLAEIYAASADLARQAQGIAPHSLKSPVGEEPVSVWHLVEDGWPSIGTSGVPYVYDSHEYHEIVRLRDPAAIWMRFDEGTGKYKKQLSRTLTLKGIQPQPRRKKPSKPTQPNPRQGGRRRPPPRSDDGPYPHSRDHLS
ncbi:hypothetical protein [Streptomyces nojiriensis]|uniref:hypothetical protein n=1 Tax=Streptomyces nojiriensis TaxID=66374 RepID=UPI00365C149F